MTKIDFDAASPREEPTPALRQERVALKIDPTAANDSESCASEELSSPSCSPDNGSPSMKDVAGASPGYKKRKREK